jgi:hypothetical protein
MPSGNARACTTLATALALVAAFLFVALATTRFYDDYSTERDLHDREATRLRTSWLYECADERERLPREIQLTCNLWKEKLLRYTRVGVKNVALASTLDAWFASYTDGIGTRLVQMGYNLVWMGMMLSLCVGFLLFCAAFFVTRIASVLSQSSYALPLAERMAPHRGAAAYLTSHAMAPPHERGRDAACVELVEDAQTLTLVGESRKSR